MEERNEPTKSGREPDLVVELRSAAQLRYDACLTADSLPIVRRCVAEMFSDPRRRMYHEYLAGLGRCAQIMVVRFRS